MMSRRILLLAAMCVAAGAGAMLLLEAVLRPYPPQSSLAAQVLPEWAFIVKPEREAMLYHVFLAVSLIGFCGAAYGWREWLARGTSALGSLAPKAPWRWADGWVIAAVIACVAGVDPAAAIRHMSNYFLSVDSFFMGPAWAVINGRVLNVDVTSSYSLLAPRVAAAAMQAMGQVDYPALVTVMATGAGLYYAAFYVFLRMWLRSVPAAVIGVSAGICLQMFHSGVYPMIWALPSATPWRYLLDVPVLLLVAFHARHRNAACLWAAAVGTGFALAWMADTGIYLFCALAFYVVADIAMQAWHFKKQNWGRLFILVLPWFVMGVTLWAVTGPAFWTAAFWENSVEFAGLFLSGWGALPVTTSWDMHLYGAFLLGVAVPLFYAVTLLAVAGSCLMRRMAWEHMMTAVLCVYGLGLYHYYVARSAPTSYLAVCLPAVAAGMWWVVQWQRQVSPGALRCGVWMMLMWNVILWAGANPAILDYPWFWNTPARERPGYAWGPDSTSVQDTAMIDRWTSPAEAVAVLSSFDVAVLRDARRKPFFYFFPLVIPAERAQPVFNGTCLHTPARLARVIRQLEQGTPHVVFIEKKLVDGTLPPFYYEHYQTLTLLLAYIQEHYVPAEQGKFLCAWVRKEV